MKFTYKIPVTLTIVLEDDDTVLASKLALRGLKALSAQFSDDEVIGGYITEGITSTVVEEELGRGFLYDHLR